MIVWRGWGWLIVGLPIMVAIAGALILDSMGFNGLAPEKAAALVYREFAASLALSMLLLWPLVRRRNRTAPGIDHLGFIPMRFWLPVGLVGAIGLLIASFVPAALQGM